MEASVGPRPPIVVALVALAAGLGLAWPASLEAVPQEAALLVGLAAGLPHGAGDHLIADGWRRVGLVLAYSGVALLGIGVWSVAPVAFTLLFLAASAWHFGQADLHGWPARSGWSPALWLGRGAVMVGLPLLGHPDEAWPVLEAMAAGPLPRPELDARWLVVVHAASLLAALPARRWPRALGELGVLSTWLWVAPPLLGFAWVFAVWHSAPHLGWMRATLGRSRLAWARALVAPTLAAAAGAALLLGSLHAHTALVAIAALTLPHTMVVERLLRR